MKQTDAERELDSQEAEKLARTILGLEIPPSTENLAEKIEAARKRVGRQSAQQVLPTAP